MSDEETNDELEYQVYLIQYGDEFIKLKIDFENPLGVSQGDILDKIRVKFIDPDLFVSQDSGKTLKTS